MCTLWFDVSNLKEYEEVSNLCLEASSKSTCDIAKEIDLESENLLDSVAGTVQTSDEV